MHQSFSGACPAARIAGIHSTSLHLHHGRAHAHQGADRRGTGEWEGGHGLRVDKTVWYGSTCTDSLLKSHDNAL